MKLKQLKIILLGLMVIAIALQSAYFVHKRSGVMVLPSLPKPIAKEYVLVTSAGQGTNSYIINDIVNKLMIHNYFMPQAEQEDIENVNTVVFIVDYSDLGVKLHNTSYEDEKRRIMELVQKSEQEQLSVITLYLGGKKQHLEKAKELLKLISGHTDYLIGTKNADQDGFLSELAKTNKIPLTLVNGVNDLSEPFASAFR